MKKVLLLFAAFCFCVIAYSQKVYFIYVQSDNNAPFFIRMANKVYSSTASGYVILSNLTDSTYTFSIGFPGNQTTETTFAVSLNRNDKGFLIKNVDNGLTLFDLQSLQTHKPVSSTQPQSSSGSTSKADNFTQLLAKAADDTSLLSILPIQTKTEIAVKKEKPLVEERSDPDTTAATLLTKDDSTLAQPVVPSSVAKINQPEIKVELKVNTDSATAKSQVSAPDTTNNVSKIEVQEPPYQRSTVIRRAESSTTEGFGLVFLDKYAAGVDTVRLIIPNPKIIFTEESNPKAITPLPTDTSDTKMQTVSAATPKLQSNNCKSVASESDFFKLRKAMASKSKEEAMINEAKGNFKKRCFTSEQLKNLSTLFLTPEGKYLFFDAAYLHVADLNNFNSLQSEIKDDYYSGRFKTLLSNR